MFPKKQSAVLYLLKSGFYLYVVGYQNILSVSFPPDTVKDIEVISVEKLLVLLNTFFVTNKLMPLSAVVVLSPDILFEKDVILSQNLAQHAENLTNREEKADEVTKQKNEEAAIIEYLNYVPFDDKLSMSFKVPQGKHIAVTNKAIIDGIVLGLQKFQSEITAVIPYFVYGKADVFAQGLTDQSAHLILQRGDVLKQNNMLIFNRLETVQQDGIAQTTKPREPSNNKRLFILTGLFVVLLVGMVVFYFLSQQQIK